MAKVLRFLFLFILLSCFASRVLSQETEQATISKVNAFIDSLKSNNISKIGFKKDYCVGCIQWVHIDSNGRASFKCDMYFTLYLFWQNREKGYIKKFDACGPSNEVIIDPIEVFEYPDKYAGKMKKEELKPFSSWEKNPNGDSTLVDSYIDHWGHCDLLFLDKQDSIFRDIDFYSLVKEFNGTQNLNYSENKRLKIVEWEERLSNIISKLEKEEKFKR